jgi:hypothetical protein
VLEQSFDGVIRRVVVADRYDHLSIGPGCATGVEKTEIEDVDPGFEFDQSLTESDSA